MGKANLVIIEKETGDVVLPTPSEYNATTSTYVDSARNSKGYVIGSVIRERVEKIELTWKYLTAQEWADILSLFLDNDTGNAFYVNVKFYVQDKADYEEKEMYVGDRKANLWRCDPETGEPIGWTNCKLSLIEV